MSPRRLWCAAFAIAVAFGTPACGGDTMKVAAQGAGTYGNGSGPEEYCGLLEAASPQISHDLTSARPAAVQPTIGALGDLSIVAPEEVKVDIALIRGYLQLVLDASSDDTSVTDDELAAANEALSEVNERVSESVAETCGVSLD